MVATQLLGFLRNWGTYFNFVNAVLRTNNLLTRRYLCDKSSFGSNLISCSKAGMKMLSLKNVFSWWKFFSFLFGRWGCFSTKGKRKEKESMETLLGGSNSTLNFSNAIRVFNAEICVSQWTLLQSNVYSQCSKRKPITDTNMYVWCGYIRLFCS